MIIEMNSFVQVTLWTLLIISFQSRIGGQPTSCPPSQTNIQTCPSLDNDRLEVWRVSRALADLHNDLDKTRSDIANVVDEVKLNVDKVTDKVDKVTDKVDNVTDKVDKVSDKVDELTRIASDIVRSVLGLNKNNGKLCKNLTEFSTIVSTTSASSGMILLADCIDYVC